MRLEGIDYTFLRANSSMSSLRGNLTILQSLNDDMFRRLAPTVVVLSAIMVVGAVGNVLVCYIFIRKLRKSIQNFFLLWLGIFDLLSSCVGVPSEIFDIRHYYLYESEELCKAMRFLTTFPSLASILVLLAIAFDRYRKICKPLHQQIHLFHARVVIAVIVITALVFSVPAIYIYGHRSFSTPVLGVNGYDCSVDDTFKDRPYPLGYEGIFFAAFIICTVILASIYMRIWLETRRHIKYLRTHATFGNAVFDEPTTTNSSVVYEDSLLDNNPNDLPQTRSRRSSTTSLLKRLSRGLSRKRNRTKAKNSNRRSHNLAQICESNNVSDHAVSTGQTGVRNLVLMELDKRESRGEKNENPGNTFGASSKVGESSFKTSKKSWALDGQTTPQQLETLIPKYHETCFDSTPYPDLTILDRDIRQSSPLTARPSVKSSKQLNDVAANIDVEHTSSREPSYMFQGPISSEDRFTDSIVNSSQVHVIETGGTLTNDQNRALACQNNSCCCPNSPNHWLAHSATCRHCDPDCNHCPLMTEQTLANIPQGIQPNRISFLVPTDSRSDGLVNPVSPEAPLFKSQVSRKSNQSLSAKRARKALRATRTTVIAFVITIGFILSYLPHLILIILRSVKTDFEHHFDDVSLIFYNIFIRSYFVNNVINVFVYGSMNIEFRTQIVQVWRWIRCSPKL